MKAPLRPFAVLVVGLAYLCAFSGGAVYAASSSFPLDTSSADEKTSASPATDSVIIPGPLRSFLRMAGISQKILPDEVLPLLARNSYLQGYQDGHETEFLLLLDRYVHQARELQALAGQNDTIRVNSCDDAVPLIQILGYRLRSGCGQKNVSLVTTNPERAFLTIDSGFPLTGLEEALQKGTPFTYSFPSTRVPVLFRENDWMTLSAKRKDAGNLVDVLLHDPEIARLYWALARNDVETGLALQRSPGLQRLLPYAPVLDFYGSQICIRSGHVIVPGDASAERNWKDLVGASPDSPGDFVLHLVSKDKGWLAAYFDVLSRVDQTQQQHLTENPRLKHLYDAFRESNSSEEPSATRGVYRKAPELLVLYTRLQWAPDGEPYVPGNLDVWKELLNQKTDSKLVRDWAKRSRSWNSPEQLLEALTAFSRMETDSGPLQIYIMLSELDRQRSPEMRLSAGTVRLMANKFSQLSSWYLIFSEFPDLNDTSITRFVNVADAIDGISNQSLRGNTLGAFQANIGLWQILARQGEIPTASLNPSWQKVVDPFAKVSSSTQLFDAAHSSLGELLVASTGKANRSQDEIVDLLVGPHQESADGQRMHAELAGRIRSVLDDQRLVSLDTLFALSDGLDEMAHGATIGGRLVPLAGELREFEMPRPIFTESEKINWASAVYTSRHAELQIRTDLTKVIKTPGSPAQLETARGQLAPFLRDTLVGLNYAYYEPPGAQVLHSNPLLVRSHDFTGLTIVGAQRLWRPPELFGVGIPAGGGAYLMGSLADLPYALATTEEDFIAPENVQALIWKEIVPDLLVSATVPRWWGVSQDEFHAVTLYQRSGEELLTASVENVQLRGKVIGILSERMAPRRLELTEQALQRPETLAVILPRMMPEDTFYLASEYRRRYPGEAASLGAANQQLENLCHQHPAETKPEHISKDFGVPHPTLARNNSLELLNVKPFPAFGGYSSRLFGESWESNNLYWARLADEMGYSPVMLNRLVPELTRQMIAKIFATDLEDWRAVLRAMEETGDEFRQGKIASLPGADSHAER